MSEFPDQSTIFFDASITELIVTFAYAINLKFSPKIQPNKTDGLLKFSSSFPPLFPLPS